MNIFFLMKKEGGEEGVELVTSPLDAGDILDGEGALRESWLSSLLLLLVLLPGGLVPSCLSILFDAPADCPDSRHGC